MLGVVPRTVPVTSPSVMGPRHARVAIALALLGGASGAELSRGGAGSAGQGKEVKPANVGVGSQDDVASWLDEAGFGNLKRAFAKNVIDGPALRELTEDELRELGMNKIGCVRRRGGLWSMRGWRRLDAPATPFGPRPCAQSAEALWSPPVRCPARLPQAQLSTPRR